METSDSISAPDFLPGESMEIPSCIVEKVRMQVAEAGVGRGSGRINSIIQRINMLHDNNYSTLRALYKHIQSLKGELDSINLAKSHVTEGEISVVLAQSEFQFQFIPFKIQLFKYTKCGRYILNVISAQLS